MDANKIQYPSERLYFKYQLEIFCAVVLFCWMEEQRKAITLSKTYDQVIVGGDARCDCKFLGLLLYLCSRFVSSC